MTPTSLLNAALVGAFAFAGLHHLYLWRTSPHTRSLLLVALYSGLSAIQMVGIVGVTTTTDVGYAQLALDTRATAGLAATAMLAWLIAELTRYRPKKFLVPLTVLLSTGVAISCFASITGRVTGFTGVEMPWGETIQVISRERGYPLIAVPLYAGVLSVYAFAAVAGIRWAKVDRTAGFLTAIAGINGVFIAAFSLLIDLEVVRSPYLGQVSNSLWILLATILLSREHAAREKQLAASERRFHAIFDQTFQFIGLMSTDGRVLEANRTALAFAGIPESAVIGRYFWDTPWWTHSPELQAQLKDAVVRACSGEMMRFQASHPRPDGTLAYVDFSLKPVRDDGGSVTMLIPEGRDITDSKRFEEALKVSELRYRKLIESAPEAIVVLDVEAGRFVDVNPQACRLFGIPEAALRERGPLDVSPAVQPDGRDSRAVATEHVNRAVGGAEQVFDWTHRDVNGRDIPCEIRLVRLPDPSRILIRGSITDVSARRTLEEQLRQSQKMEAIGQLAGGVAHDFNNLLTVIAGYAEILMAKLPAGDPNANIAKAIGDATERAAWLTARLLAFGRRAVLAPQVFDLNSLVGDGERILRRLIGEHIALRVHTAAAPLNVRLDPGQWSQVMLNLAINARDAMPAGGVLTIRTYSHVTDAAALPGMPPGRYAAFSVNDTGFGMAPDVRARIFEPFFTTKEVSKGTGLGLAVVHGIVSQAGGRIDVETAPGAGTTFTVYLPAVDGTPDQGRAVPAHRDHGAGESILVVEDEAVLRELLEVALTSHGFRVTTASNGDEALRLVESMGSRLDLLVTDMVMPGRLNGRALADAVRRRSPAVKVLFISGYIDDPAIRDSGFGHDEPCLQKPFSLAAIAQKARDTLDGN